MFAMLVVAAALIRFNFVHSRASNEDHFDSKHVAKIFSEDDMTPDFTEQLGSHDHTTDIKKRSDVGKEDKYGPPQNEVRTTTKPVAGKPVTCTAAHNLSQPNAPGHNAPGHNAPGHNAPGHNAPGHNASVRNAPYEEKRLHHIHEGMDVDDREDHVTQYLSDQLVNTDSEITSLQPSEVEDERGDSVEVKEDSFFAFLTGQEKAVEVDGAWSRPADDDLLPMITDQEVNDISDVEYKD